MNHRLSEVRLFILILASLSLPSLTNAQNNIYVAQAVNDYNLGLRLHNMGRYRDALKLYSRSIQFDPNSWEAYCNRGSCIWKMKGNLNLALRDLNTAVRLNPKSSISYSNRGNVWHDLGQLDNAIKDQTKAISLNAGFASAYSNRGNSWDAKNDHDRAIKDFTAAIRLKPNHARYYVHRGLSWSRKKEYELAIRDFTKVIELQSNCPATFHDRGSSWNNIGEYEKALKDLNTALKQKPKYPISLNLRAWILATCPRKSIRNSGQAIADAKLACELTNWKNGSYVDTLAAAFADKGDFEQAIKYQKMALKLKPSLKASAEKKIRLFQNQKAFRTTSPR